MGNVTVLAQLISTLLTALTLPTGLAGLAAIAVTGLLLVVLVHQAANFSDPATSPTHTRAIALKECARKTAFLRLRDPGAPGRTRSRAPGTAAAA